VRKISLLSVAVLFAFCLATSLARADTLGAPTTVRHHLAQSLAAAQVPLSNPFHLGNPNLTSLAPAQAAFNGSVRAEVTPEPAPLILMGTGLLAIALFLRKRLAANSV
jgi:hypothetical protein